MAQSPIYRRFSVFVVVLWVGGDTPIGVSGGLQEVLGAVLDDAHYPTLAMLEV